MSVNVDLNLIWNGAKTPIYIGAVTRMGVRSLASLLMRPTAVDDGLYPAQTCIRPVTIKLALFVYTYM